MGRADEIERLASLVVDCGFRIHSRLGPGLLESVYEVLLAESLIRRGCMVDRQRSIDIRFDGIEIRDGFRADILVNGLLLVEVKSVERLAPVHGKQVLTYLRLLDLPPGLLINFGGATFKEGIKRVAHNYDRFAP